MTTKLDLQKVLGGIFQIKRKTNLPMSHKERISPRKIRVKQEGGNAKEAM